MKEKVLKLLNNLVKQDTTRMIVSHEEKFVEKVWNKIIRIESTK